VSRQVRERAVLVRISQRMRGGGSFPALAGTSLGPRNWPSIPLPQDRPFAWRDAEGDARHWKVWFTHSPLLQPEECQATVHRCVAVGLHRHPYREAFQTGVSIERQSPVFFLLTLGHSLRCLSRAQRHGAALLRMGQNDSEAMHGEVLAPAPCGFRLSENLCATNAKRFSEPSEKAPLVLGSGAHSHPTTHKSCVGDPGISRRFAQECPEGNPGKYKQGELTWHSTKTRSL
jgi:hypothetical protein